MSQIKTSSLQSTFFLLLCIGPACKIIGPMKSQFHQSLPIFLYGFIVQSANPKYNICFIFQSLKYLLMLVQYLTYCLHFIFANYIDVLCRITVPINLIRNLANKT